MELLYIAQYLGIPMDEVAVNWQEIEGEPFCFLSSMSPFYTHLIGSSG